MRQQWVLLALTCFMTSSLARVIRKGSANETLLVGQIRGPTGQDTRNLQNMLLSMNVFMNDTPVHTSLLPINYTTFPLNYSIELSDKDFQAEKAEIFRIIAIIWQPAYLFDNHVHVAENELDTYDFTMHSVKFAIIRGKIIHDKHSGGNQTLPATKVKLELIENKSGKIIDQVDFNCTSNNYPCPFEYLVNTARVKKNVQYQLEAIISDQHLPARKSINTKHSKVLAVTKSSNESLFTINPEAETGINNYVIVVSDYS